MERQSRSVGCGASGAEERRLWGISASLIETLPHRCCCRCNSCCLRYRLCRRRPNATANRFLTRRLCPPGLTQVDYLTGALLDSYLVPDTAMPGNDNVNEFVGALVLSGDMQSVSYVGQSTTAAGAAAGDVIIHRHSSADPTLALGDATTTIPGASWGGVGKVAKAACSMDGSGYWVVGDPAPVRYVPHGGTQAGVVVYTVPASKNFNGCQLMAVNVTSGLPKAMYFAVSISGYVYVYSAPNPAENWATSITMPTTTVYISGSPYYGKQVISNRARTRFFVNEPYNCGSACTAIWYCDGLPGACGQVTATGFYAMWSIDAIITGGIALSPDDTRLFYTTAQQIWWIPAIGPYPPAAPVAVGPELPVPQGQFRGISWAPAGSSCGIGIAGLCCSPGAPGYYCTGGVLPLLPCPAGQYSAGGVSSCTLCPLGVTSAGPRSASVSACTVCAPNFFGVVTSPGTMAAAGCTACPPGSFSAAGAASCTVCAAGFYLADDRSGCVACPVGTYTSGTNSVSVEACAICAPGFAGTIVSPGTTSAMGCAACAAGSFAPANASSCSMCPSGSYSFGATSACSICATGAALISATAGCTPSALTAGPADTAFYLSGSSVEGTAALSGTAPQFSAGPFSAIGLQVLVTPSPSPSVSPSSPTATTCGLTCRGASSMTVRAVAALSAPVRYFRISTTIGDGVMNFAEFELWTESPFACGMNVALSSSGAVASQSSIYDGAAGGFEFGYCGANSDLASAAIDGNLCTYQAEWFDAAPWWEVDLGREFSASELVNINIFPRTVVGAGSTWAYRIDSALLQGFSASRTLVLNYTLPADTSTLFPLSVPLLSSGQAASCACKLNSAPAPATPSLNSALLLASGSRLSVPGAGAPTALPSGGNVAFSASAWVKCPAPSNSLAAVLAWGSVGDAQGVASPGAAALVVGAMTNFASVSTLAGGNRGFIDGLGAAARFSSPQGIATDRNGDFILADGSNNRIRKLTKLGAVTTIAGTGVASFSDGASLSVAAFSAPSSVALVPSSGVVVISDSGNHRIRLLSPSGVVTTLAGGAGGGFADGFGTNALFKNPWGVAVVPSSEVVIIGDYGNNRIRTVSSLGIVATLAGSDQGFADGFGQTARFSMPRGVAVIGLSGNIVVSDSGNNRIRLVTPIGVVTTLAGGGTAGLADGSGQVARFNLGNPSGLTAISSSSRVLIAAENNFCIRLVTPQGAVSTIAGRGSTGTADGAGTSAGLAGPAAIAPTSDGASYVFLDGSKVRLLTIPPVLPACDATWHHIAVVYSPLASPYKLSAFIDGERVFAQAAEILLPAAPASTLRIGWSGEVAVNADSPFAGAVSELRIYSRALTADEVLALSQPLLPTLGPGTVALSALAPGTTSYSVSCAGGFVGGPVAALTRNASDGSWSSSLGGGGPRCSACTASTYSYGGTGPCAPCAAGAVFSSSVLGCSPTSAFSIAGPADTAFSLSGSAAEGVAAFPTIGVPCGISFVSGPKGATGSAMSLAKGSYLGAAGTTAPPLLPSGGGGTAAFSASAWVKCAAPATWSSVLEWGTAGDPWVGTLDAVHGALTLAVVGGRAPNAITSTLTASVGTYPVHAFFDSSNGVIFVALYSSNIINIVYLQGAAVVRLAGNGGSAFSDGTGTNAWFKGPTGVVSSVTSVAEFRHCGVAELTFHRACRPSPAMLPPLGHRSVHRRSHCCRPGQPPHSLHHVPGRRRLHSRGHWHRRLRRRPRLEREVFLAPRCRRLPKHRRHCRGRPRQQPNPPHLAGRRRLYTCRHGDLRLCRWRGCKCRNVQRRLFCRRNCSQWGSSCG